MRAHLLSTITLVAAIALTVHGTAVSQTAQLAPGQVSGVELQAWVDADGLAVGGINLLNQCQWLAKTHYGDRYLTVICSSNLSPWTVKGEGKVVGNRYCQKMRYPDGGGYDDCEEFFKIGDNRYETRLDGKPTQHVYRLIP